MKTLCNSLTIGLLLFSLVLHSQTKSLSDSKPQAMKEYILLLHYPNITYSPQQLETLKQQWSKTLSGWKTKGVYISNQVLEPKGTIITTESNTDEAAFAQNSSFIGATVTLLAENKEQAIALAKETPVFSVGGSIEIREPRYINKSNGVTFIDTFIIPEKARETFINRMNINRNLLKTLPGFIEDTAYEKTAGDSKFNYITIAVWESEEAITNAKKTVASQYEKEGFNLPEFIMENGIIMERAVYKEIRE